MYHHPESTVLVFLQFDKVVSTTKRGEFQRAVSPADEFEAGVAEGGACYVLRLRYCRLPISAAGRHCVAKVCQNLSGNPRNTQCCSLNVRGYGQHATSDVASDCLWIDQTRCGDDNTYTYIRRQMDVRHDRYLPNIRRTSEAFDRF
jgi:hypothetical protein